MYAYYVPAWESFAIATLAAAAVLMGLILVAISGNMQQVLRYPWRISRAGDSVVQLLGALVACALVLMPQPQPVLGGGLAAVGLVAAGGLVFRGLRRRDEVETAFRRRANVQALLGVIAVALYVPAGASLLLVAGGGLYWLAAATLLSLGLATANSWMLLVEVKP